MRHKQISATQLQSLLCVPCGVCAQLCSWVHCQTKNPYEAFDGTWTRFPGHLRRGRAGHWRHAGSLTRAVPAALVLPRTGSSVDVDILVRQDLTNTHASELFSNQCPNLPGGYECTNGRAEHVEALHFAIGQPTATSARALGSKDAPEIHTCGRRMSCVPVLTQVCEIPLYAGRLAG